MGCDPPEAVVIGELSFPTVDVEAQRDELIHKTLAALSCRGVSQDSVAPILVQRSQEPVGSAAAR